MKHRLRRDGPWPRKIPLRDASLYVDVVGQGPPLVLMHGGPSADLWTMGAFRQFADQYTLVFYDHRCNGRSTGTPVSTMTWENLTADADALREFLGFESWSVLGHSFGGHVALEYALRYPERVSRLILLDTAADSRWARDNAPQALAERGCNAVKVELVRKWFHGDFKRSEYFPTFFRISGLYMYGPGWRPLARELVSGGWRTKMRPEALIFAGRHLMEGWSVTGRLGEIHAPTLIMAGREDFVFPPESQWEMAAGIRGSRLVLVDAAGHSPQDEQPSVVMSALQAFLEGVRPG
jgi:proline iminopeptidase